MERCARNLHYFFPARFRSIVANMKWQIISLSILLISTSSNGCWSKNTAPRVTPTPTVTPDPTVAPGYSSSSSRASASVDGKTGKVTTTVSVTGPDGKTRTVTRTRDGHGALETSLGSHSSSGTGFTSSGGAFASSSSSSGFAGDNTVNHRDGRTGADAYAWGSSNMLFNNGHHGNNGAGSWSSGFDSAFSPGASESTASARSTVSSDNQGSPRFQSEVITEVMMGNGTVRRERQVVNNFNS